MTAYFALVVAIATDNLKDASLALDIAVCAFFAAGSAVGALLEMALVNLCLEAKARRSRRRAA